MKVKRLINSGESDLGWCRCWLTGWWRCWLTGWWRRWLTGWWRCWLIGWWRCWLTVCWLFGWWRCWLVGWWRCWLNGWWRCWLIWRWRCWLNEWWLIDFRVREGGSWNQSTHSSCSPHISPHPPTAELPFPPFTWYLIITLSGWSYKQQRPKTTLKPLSFFGFYCRQRRWFRKRKGGRDGDLRAVGLMENPKAGNWIRGVPWFQQFELQSFTYNENAAIFQDKLK